MVHLGKLIVAVAIIVGGVSTSLAQDGFYGSFQLGQKIVNMDPLNQKLTELNTANALNGPVDPFANNYWILGGEGHAILAKHLVLGGKGMVCFKEHKTTPEKVTTLNTTMQPEEIKITMGLGLATLGYAFLAGSDKQIRLYPQIGGGLTTFLLQHKYPINPDTTSFNEAFVDDGQSVIQKIGWAVDGALGLDYYIELIELKRLVPGLNFGPLVHAEIGYTFVGKNMKWMRDVKPINDFNPDLSLKGFYFNVGLGLGLSSRQSGN